MLGVSPATAARSLKAQDLARRELGTVAPAHGLHGTVEPFHPLLARRAGRAARVRTFQSFLAAIGMPDRSFDPCSLRREA